MISNSIRHNPAGQDGGTFTLTIRTRAGRAWIEVSGASSGEWQPDHDSGCPDDETGRGLAIIAALADTFGHHADAVSQTVWA
jgi:anti-sigma regulatory factor (Ser/Thr protein kinase)